MVRLMNIDAFVKRRPHTKITEITKNNLNIIKMSFFVPLRLIVTLYLAIV